MKQAKIPKDINMDLLVANAISAMAFARPERSKLPVGCAVLDTKHTIYTGANLEVLWQQVYHAEEVAITGAIAHDSGPIRVIVVAAVRKLFTPCGKCMDVIMKYAKDDAIVVHVNPKTHIRTALTLLQIMPFYPTHV
jgi:cytidine deaminase